MTQRHPMTLMPVLYDRPGTDRVVVRDGLTYPSSTAGNPPLAFDLYLPPDPPPGPLPVVVFVAGFPDPGFERFVGCKLKDMASYVTWAKLVASAGIAAITYTNVDPAGDIAALLAHVTNSGRELGLDPERIGLWACSGNGPTALAMLMRDQPPVVRAALLAYAYLVDLDGATDLAAASRQFGNSVPTAGKTIDDVRADVPIYLVRAGGDVTPGLNAGLDRFVAHALAKDLPLAFVNVPGAPHAFDLTMPGAETGRRVESILSFFKARLSA